MYMSWGVLLKVPREDQLEVEAVGVGQRVAVGIVESQLLSMLGGHARPTTTTE